MMTKKEKETEKLSDDLIVIVKLIVYSYSKIVIVNVRFAEGKSL
jgi:hypothetical protein